MEQIVPESEEPSFSKLLDPLMLVLFGGKDRTATEWGTLLHDSGFELMSIAPAPGTNLIEAAPA